MQYWLRSYIHKHVTVTRFNGNSLKTSWYQQISKFPIFMKSIRYLQYQTFQYQYNYNDIFYFNCPSLMYESTSVILHGTTFRTWVIIGLLRPLQFGLHSVDRKMNAVRYFTHQTSVLATARCLLYRYMFALRLLTSFDNPVLSSKCIVSSCLCPLSKWCMCLQTSLLCS